VPLYFGLSSEFLRCMRGNRSSIASKANTASSRARFAPRQKMDSFTKRGVFVGTAPDVELADLTKSELSY